MNIPKTLLVVLLLAVSYGIYQYYNQDDNLDNLAPSNHATLEISLAKMNVFNVFGEPKYNLIVKHAELLRNNKFKLYTLLAYLNQSPTTRTTVNESQVQTSLFLNASSAEVFKSQIFFNDQVRVFNIDPYSPFKWATFTRAVYDSKTKVLSSDTPIEVTGKQAHITAQSFLFDLQAQEFFFDGGVVSELEF